MSGIPNVENHAYWQKLFRYELRLQETPGTISRSGHVMPFNSISYSLKLFDTYRPIDIVRHLSQCKIDIIIFYFFVMGIYSTFYTLCNLFRQYMILTSCEIYRHFTLFET
jgi:hypothetical protein